jgi:rod shape-determining protein MreD
MTYFLRIVLVAFIIFVLQVTVVHEMKVAGSSPDLIMVLLVVIVMDRKPIAGIVAGFLLGFLQDLGNASFLGMNALAKSVVGYGIAKYGSDYLPDNVIFRGLLVLLACLINDVITLNVSTYFDPGEVIVQFFRYSILSAVYTALLAVLLLKLIDVLPRRMVRSGGRY